MRKVAGKCVALFMALLMLLSSMPLTALAEAQTNTSAPITVQAQPRVESNAVELPATAAEAAQDAAVDNVSSGEYVSLGPVSVSGVTVENGTNYAQTGATFTYTIPYYFDPAPSYRDPESDSPVPAYDTYTDVKITVSAPDGFVLLVDGAEHRSYTFTLADQSLTAAGGGTVRGEITVDARISGNGTVANAAVSGSPSVNIEAKAAGATFTYARSDAPSVTNKAEGHAWAIEKLNGNDGVPTEDADGNLVFTWTVNAGELAGNSISSNENTYDRAGALQFASFAITDDLPVVTNNGVDYAPTNVTVTRDGVNVPFTQNGTTITIENYKTTTLDTGYSSDAPQIPAYSTYTISATYAREAFELPYSMSGQYTALPVENDVALTYQFRGQSEQSDAAEANTSYYIPENGVTLTVKEQIKIGTDGEATDYNEFYALHYPGGAEFDVYTEAAWNNGNPSGEPIAQLAVENSSGASVTLPAGTYYVKQTAHPQGSNALSDEEVYQEIELTADGTLTFVNVIPLGGRLEIEKIDGETNAKLADVEFTITPIEGGEVYTLTTKSDGYGVVSLPVGFYLVTESKAPANYVPCAPFRVEIKEKEATCFTGKNAVKNYSYNKTGTLTITKKLAEYAFQPAEDTKNVNDKVTDAKFEFYIYQSTDQDSFDTSDATEPFKTATITGNAYQATVSGLPVADAEGNAYYYKVVEKNGGDDRFDYDTAQPVVNFVNANGGYGTAASVTFTNVLKSKLTFRKVVEGVSGVSNMSGATFELYKLENGGLVEVDDVSTLTSNSEGIVTTPALPIKDEKGNAIQYFVKEVSAARDYTVTYPAVEGGKEGYWGPLTLEFAETTNKAGQANAKEGNIVNTRHETKITIQKTNRDGTTPLSGAQYVIADANGNYAASGATGYTFGALENAKTFTTGEDGSVTVSGLPTGTYTVIETGAPDGYLPTGSVSGDKGSQVTEDDGKLAWKVALTNPLDAATVTFQNDQKPKLTITKSVQKTDGTAATVTGKFAFELYEGSADAPGNKVEDVAAIEVTAGTATTVTVDKEGTYWLKEISYPDSVLDPALTATGEGVHVDGDSVYYGPYTLLLNRQPVEADISNTANLGTLTITKQSSKPASSGEAILLSGAEYTVSVNAANDADLAAFLAASGFTNKDGVYSKTTSATGANGQTSIELPAYFKGSLIEYTVEETTTPANYLPAEGPQTATLEKNGYVDALTFANDPIAEIKATKTFYRQWESITNPTTYRNYLLSGVQLAIFELDENGALVIPEGGVPVLTTNALGEATFEGLNGTKTYAVYELAGDANRHFVSVDDKPFAPSVDEIKKNPNGYYHVEIDLLSEIQDDPTKVDTGEVSLHNKEPYLQFSLQKWYHPWNADYTNYDTTKKLPLDRAKFQLFQCTEDQLDAVNAIMSGFGAGTTGAQAAEALKAYLYSDYIYESGTAPAAGEGSLATGPLPRTGTVVRDGKETVVEYVYWLIEIEAPAGFEEPLWKKDCWSGFLTEDSNGRSVQNYPLKGPGTIRYLQVELDKVVEDANGTRSKLADATFELWLTDGNGNVVERVAKFTTGVDLPNGTGGTDYDAGRGISESIKMHELYDEYGDWTDAEGNKGPGYVKSYLSGDTFVGEDGQEYPVYEYKAQFLLVETGWPAYTAPATNADGSVMTYTLEIDTGNPKHDADPEDASVVVDDRYTSGVGKLGPIVNELRDGVTVMLEKVGYAAEAPEKTWPLSGAEITIYRLEDGERVDERTLTTTMTGDKSVVMFTGLLPSTKYYWEETKVPAGYAKVPHNSEQSFVTPSFSSQSAGAAVEPCVTIRNVQYATVTLEKTNNAGAAVPNVTLRITRTDGNAFLYDDATTAVDYKDVTTGADGAVSIALPDGVYDVEEISVDDHDLSTAEKSNFELKNAGVLPFTVKGGENEKITLENPGVGQLTVTKKDDATEPALLEGVEFELTFKPFTENDVGADKPAAGDFGDVKAQTGVEITAEQRTTGEDGSFTLTGLVPGWYKLEEIGKKDENGSYDAFEKAYEFAEPKIIKVTDGTFGGGAASASAEFTNRRKGFLRIEKAYNGRFAEGFDAKEQSVTFEIYNTEACTGTPVTTVTITGESDDTVSLLPGTY